MKKSMCILIMCLPLIAMAQGIQWTTGLSWEEVKQKAKQENKYMFLDCYATWCGPCKAMDKSVYVSDSVGKLFNEKFISVKVQMDKTNNDDENVKKWFDDAEAINEEYHLVGYPSFVFLTPTGDVVHQDAGYKSVKELIDLAEMALQPGKVYNDPYKEYEQLIESYKQGKRNYDKYPSMIRTAIRLNQIELSHQLRTELATYVSGLPRDQRYTKEKIEMWAYFTLSSSSKTFGFFYNDAKWIDKVMNQKGYAKKVVDRTIYEEIVIPFFTEQNKNPEIAMTGMILTGPGLKPHYNEADWDKLHKMIKNKYNADYAKRNVLQAKIDWYNRHRNFPVAISLQWYQFRRYPPDFNLWPTISTSNDFAWKAFLYVTDKSLLKETIKWVRKAIKQHPDKAPMLDTYANLLYKVGSREDAIHWEQKAAHAAAGSEREAYTTVIEHMKRGEPTYLNEGAVWE